MFRLSTKSAALLFGAMSVGLTGLSAVAVAAPSLQYRLPFLGVQTAPTPAPGDSSTAPDSGPPAPTLPPKGCDTPGFAEFSTAGSFEFELPADCPGGADITVKAWGAGGGVHLSTLGGGGAGGFAQATTEMLPDQRLTIIVGAPGTQTAGGGGSAVLLDDTVVVVGGGGSGQSYSWYRQDGYPLSYSAFGIGSRAGGSSTVGQLRADGARNGADAELPDPTTPMVFSVRLLGEGGAGCGNGGAGGTYVYYAANYAGYSTYFASGAGGGYLGGKAGYGGSSYAIEGGHLVPGNVTAVGAATDPDYKLLAGQPTKPGRVVVRWQ